jgi:hypothetical protein
VPATLYGRSDEVVRILRAIKALPAEDRERRTVLYRDLAEASVALREHYLTAEGTPDWSGHTHAYRHAVRALYKAAGYQPEEARTVQSAVRYHVGNAVRRRLSPSELDAAGLAEISPVESARKIRKRQSAILAASAATAGWNEPAAEAGEPTSAAEVAQLQQALAILTTMRINRRRVPTAADLAADPQRARLTAVGRNALQAIISRAQQILDVLPEPPQ